MPEIRFPHSFNEWKFTRHHHFFWPHWLIWARAFSYQFSYHLISFAFCSVPDLLVLNDCDIDCAGEEDGLRAKCRSVRELDLAQNKLENWCEVFSIFSHMPRVEFVNLSFNPLCGPIEPPIDFALGNLRSLVLNNTRLDWESVEILINSVKSLEELHLSLNDYHNVLIDTVDDDVFREINEYKDDSNDSDGNDNDNDSTSVKHSNRICSSCGSQSSTDSKQSTFYFFVCVFHYFLFWRILRFTFQGNYIYAFLMSFNI